MPLEFEVYTCGECGKPVETEWCSDGLLPGPYALLGEVFFHAPECVDKYLKQFGQACRDERVEWWEGQMQLAMAEIERLQALVDSHSSAAAPVETAKHSPDECGRECQYYDYFEMLWNWFADESRRGAEDIIVDLDRLRLKAFASNSTADRDSYFDRLSRAYQRGELVAAARGLFRDGVHVAETKERTRHLNDLIAAANASQPPEAPVAWRVKSAAEKALNYIENTENELGIKLSCGDALREVLK